MQLKISKLYLTILTLSFSIASAQVSKFTLEVNHSISSYNAPGKDSTIIVKRTATEFRNNVSAHIGAFDPWLGIYYERLVSPFWSFDAAIGLIGGSIGTKVYYPRLSEGKFSFYTGISEGVLLLVGPKHYVPIGITHPGKNGFRWSVDVGPQIYYDNDEERQLGVSLKLGKSF